MLVVALAACAEKKQEVACNGETSKSVVASLLKDELVKHITTDFASEAANTGSNVDGSVIRATVEKISVTIEDVLTTKSDPNSTKKFCSSTLKLSVPADVVTDSDAARTMLALGNSHQQALQAGVDFDANTIKSTLDYSVQPTDDGQKIYGSTNSQNASVTFVATLVEQSLLKNALQQQKAAQAQQQQAEALKEQQRQAEIDQAQAAEVDAALKKAKSDLKAANDALNVVWNAGNKEWRVALLPEQRLWLAQRENDCKLKALDTGASGSASFDTDRLNCEVTVTAARIEVLKASVQQSLSLQPISGAQTSNLAHASQPALTTSFDCSQARSDAEHLICSDPELAADDVELAGIFAKAKAVVADQAAFRERTRQQWNYREQICRDRNCLVRWYADQKVALSQIAQSGRVDAN
jgi:hypothetical protein